MVTSTGPSYFAWHDGGMPILPPTSFLLDGQTYEFVRPERVGPVEDVKSWVLGNYPKVHALVPLQAGATGRGVRACNPLEPDANPCPVVRR